MTSTNRFLIIDTMASPEAIEKSIKEQLDNFKEQLEKNPDPNSKPGKVFDNRITG